MTLTLQLQYVCRGPWRRGKKRSSMKEEEEMEVSDYDLFNGRHYLSKSLLRMERDRRGRSKILTQTYLCGTLLTYSKWNFMEEKR